MNRYGRLWWWVWLCEHLPWTAWARAKRRRGRSWAEYCRDQYFPDDPE